MPQLLGACAPKRARDLKTVGKRELLGPTGLRSTSEHELNEEIGHGLCRGNLEFCQQGYFQLVEMAFDGRDSCTTCGTGATGKDGNGRS